MDGIASQLDPYCFNPNGRSRPARARVLGTLRALGVGALLPWLVSTAEAAPGQGRAVGSRSIRLENPGTSGWKAEFPGKSDRWRSTPRPGYDRLAIATGFFVPIFNTVNKPRKVIGRVRRGATLSARRAVTKNTCYDRSKKGVWYEVDGGGVICSTSGFELVRSAQPRPATQRNPDVDAIIPFKYARVTQSGAARLSRRPTLRQWERMASIGGPKDDASGLMVERMIGDFFLSLDTREVIGGIDFTRTVHNEYAETSALKIKDAPDMMGERLGNGVELPLAYVHKEEGTPILCADGTECGVAEKHARFQTRGFTTVGGRRYARGPRDVLVPADALRIAEKRKRPPGVNPGDKWIHINLGRQTVVAYEGDTPVYASLISSGKEGHDTPQGLYRMQRKYVTKTMRAIDPKEGLYHIEDIPYVMYYYGAYALHGAFWHDTFGNVRSHGCTNLPPADARWLFHWSEDPVPEGWHSVENLGRGTAIYFNKE